MKYWHGASTGAYFIKGQEQISCEIKGYAGDVWVTNDSDDAIAWASSHSLEEKTKAQATTLQADAIAADVVVYNDISDEDVKGHEPEEEAVP